MANYFESKNILVFPSGYRTTVDQYSRLNAEYNFVNNYTISGGNTNYIISETKEDWIKFVLGGYYFEVALTALNALGNNDLWVGIYVGTTGGDTKSKVLCKHNSGSSWTYGVSLDEGGDFKGLIYSTSDSDLASCTNKLKLLSSGSINRDALFNKINNVVLDGKSGITLKASETIGSSTVNTNLSIAQGSDVYVSSDVNGLKVNSNSKQASIQVAANKSAKILTNLKAESSTITLNDNANLALSEGTLNLPANSTEHKVVLVQGTAGTSNWLAYSTNASRNTIVERDGSGSIAASKFNGVTLTGGSSGSLTVNGNLTVSSRSNIILDLEGNINLPENTDSTTDVVWVQKIDSGTVKNSWVDVDTSGKANDTVVKRTNNGYIKAKGLTMVNADGDDLATISAAGTYLNVGSKICFDTETANLYYDDTGDKYLVSSIGIKAPAFYAISDKRLKENIELYNPQKSILDLPVYKYDFIDGAKNQIGCLAQDLQEICPEIVTQNNDGYLSINESKIVYLLLDEVKKLKQEIAELKK